MPNRIPLTLRKRFFESPVKAELVDDISNDDQEEIAKFNQRSGFWKLLPQSLRPDDLDWEWDRTISRAAYSKDDEKWVVRRRPAGTPSKETVLGVIVFRVTQSVSDSSKSLVYVKLLGVSPKHRAWDFKLFRWPGEVKGVALVLLRLASARAKHINGNEVIGLHAIGRSEDLYKRLGMERFAAGDVDGLRYYEGAIK